MTAPVRRLRPFTPTAEDAAALDARTVGRDGLLQLLADRLESAAASGNRAHTLIVGPRGSGKSHVIGVALHRAAGRAEVSSRLVVVPFDEDAVGLTRVTDLFAHVCRSLGVPATDDSSAMRRAIDDALDGRVLVLVLHNLDRVFDAIGLSGQQELRAWVETSGDVLMFATSPALFAGVRNRDRPWYNNFSVSHLEQLTLQEGRELLGRLALAYGDQPLADFIASDDGEARLKAVHALAGGSPRVWMILSECLTVEVLDDLVAAVEGLLEGLVPYYQQLLWELSGNEQRLVRALADGTVAAMSVRELATSAGLEQRTAATTLGRLADMRWVSAEKPPGLDRRITYYRLAEPMLRHHLQYRAATRQPLPIIVELLRAVFDIERRETELARVEPGSVAERLLVRSLRSESRAFDRAVSGQNPERLLAEARRWIAGEDKDRRTAEAGVAVELAVAAARGGAGAVEQVASRRGRAVTPRMIEAAAVDAGAPEAERIHTILTAMAAATTGRTSAVLTLLAVDWAWPSSDHRAAAGALGQLLGNSDVKSDEGLALDLALSRAQHVSLYDEACGRDELQRLVPRLVAQRGPDHVDVFSARRWATLSGLFTSVDLRDEIDTLITDSARVFGRDSIPTWDALELGAHSDDHHGRHELARQHYRSLRDAYEKEWGPTNANFLRMAAFEAVAAGGAGDSHGASSQLLELLARNAENMWPETRKMARASLRRHLFRVARQRRSGAADDLAAYDTDDMIELVAAAANGHAAAKARLPAELADIVDLLRADDEGT